MIFFIQTRIFREYNSTDAYYKKKIIDSVNDIYRRNLESKVLEYTKVAS